MGNLDTQRRTVLRAGAAFLGMTCIHAPALALRTAGWEQGRSAPQPEASDFWQVPRWVWLKRPETGESIRQMYWQDGRYSAEACEAISWFMRDLRFERMLLKKSPVIDRALDTGRITRQHLSPWMMMDPVLLDILYAYSAWLQSFEMAKPILLTSALRHVLTNEATEGAVRDSWHTKGGAADIVIPEVPVANAAAFGRWLSGGGVGLYASKRFVHLDRGRVRSWSS